MIESSNNVTRCGIILAGGEGQRLQSFIRSLRGDGLPKQFVNFIGARSMLEHTFARAEMLIPPERLFTVVSQVHLDLPEVGKQLARRPAGTVIEQPQNKETLPGLLLPLIHVLRHDPEAVVAVFPSDHFIVEEALFMTHVDLALRIAERYPSFIVLLGIEPDDPEPEYGYILPDKRQHPLSPLRARRVARFVEKPDPSAVHELLGGGALWNTMVMAFKVKTLLQLVRRRMPSLYGSFRRVAGAIGTRSEPHVVKAVYRRLETVNFSRELLQAQAQDPGIRLLVLPVRGVLWSDWGSETRVLAALRKVGLLGRLRQPAASQESRPSQLGHDLSSTRSVA
ncbi:MAG: NTP transferase domain-containing protein [Deltaproteobacteria bacterium]|nr:NTP transferase domain-containing protein [Deltaproteobacteria bacterium]